MLAPPSTLPRGCTRAGWTTRGYEPTYILPLHAGSEPSVLPKTVPSRPVGRPLLGGPPAALSPLPLRGYRSHIPYRFLPSIYRVPSPVIHRPVGLLIYLFLSGGLDHPHFSFPYIFHIFWYLVVAYLFIYIFSGPVSYLFICFPL